MFKKIIIYAIAFLLFENFEAKANNEINTLTLNDVVNLAVENNPKLKEEKEKIKIGDAEIITANIIPNPTAVFEGSHLQLNYKLGFQSIIETANKRNLRINEAKEKKKTYEIEYFVVKNELINSVKKIFYQIYILQEKKNKFQELINLAEEINKLSEKKEIAGDIPKIDLLQTELSVLLLQTEINKIDSDIQKSKDNLNHLLGENIAFSDKFKVVKPPDKVSACLSFLNTSKDAIKLLNKIALDKRLDFQENILKNNLYASQQALVTATTYPNITIYSGTEFFYDNTFKSGIFINLNIDLPIFDVKQGEIAQIETKISVNNLGKKVIENNIKFEVLSAYNSFKSSSLLKKEYEKSILPLSKELLKKYQLSFESGKVNIIYVLNTQQTFLNNQINYLQILNDYYSSIIELERVIQCT